MHPLKLFRRKPKREVQQRAYDRQAEAVEILMSRRLPHDREVKRHR